MRSSFFPQLGRDGVEEATEVMLEAPELLVDEVDRIEMLLLLLVLLIENMDPMSCERLPSRVCLGRMGAEGGPFANASARMVAFSRSAWVAFSSATSRPDSRTWSRTPSRFARTLRPSWPSLMGTTTPPPERRRISMRPRRGRKVTSLTTVPIHEELSPVRMVCEGRSLAVQRD
jgi:hypothetical protein